MARGWAAGVLQECRLASGLGIAQGCRQSSAEGDATEASGAVNQKHVDVLVANISLCWLNIIAVLELGSGQRHRWRVFRGQLELPGRRFHEQNRCRANPCG